MVETILTDKMIESGAQLVRRLDESKLEFDAAFWLYSSDREAWRLVIAHPELGELGPRKIYRRIDKVMMKFQDEITEVALADVTLFMPDNPIVSAIRKAMRKSPGISGTRLTNTGINGILIEGAYIYRVKRRSRGAARKTAKK